MPNDIYPLFCARGTTTANSYKESEALVCIEELLPILKGIQGKHPRFAPEFNRNYLNTKNTLLTLQQVIKSLSCLLDSTKETLERQRSSFLFHYNQLSRLSDVTKLAAFSPVNLRSLPTTTEVMDLCQQFNPESRELTQSSCSHQ